MDDQELAEFIRTAPERLEARFKRLCAVPEIRAALQQPAPKQRMRRMRAGNETGPEIDVWRVDLGRVLAAHRVLSGAGR